jgi:sulfur-oxidizing protein SoxY
MNHYQELEMNQQRRVFLKSGGGLGLFAFAVATGLVNPLVAFADADWNDKAFAAKSLDDVVKAFGGASAAESADIALSVPEIAENGAVVPVSVDSKLAKTQSIAILVENNPSALSAQFDIPEGTDPSISTRVKMGETSNIIALVKTDTGYFYASRQVKVTLGGCGG